MDLYSGALFINQALHWNIYWSILALLLLTAIFTTTGGLAAVIYTDTLQFFIMIIGAMVVAVKGSSDNLSLSITLDHHDIPVFH